MFRRAHERGVCPWCGYATVGLAVESCPECGNNFDESSGRRAPGPPDPGTRGRARWAMLLALALILAVALVQQIGGSTFSKASVAPSPDIVPPEAQFEITARIFTKFQKWSKDASLGVKALEALDGQAAGPEDELRAAIAAGELITLDDAGKRLEKVEEKVKPDSPLRQDLEALQAIYGGERPTPETAARLKKHHGYFGELAASHGLPDTDPERERLIGGGLAIFVLVLFVGALVVGAFIAGTVLLIMLLVGYGSGRAGRAFVPPAPGGSMAIEVVAVFALGFLILKGLITVVESNFPAREAMWFGLIAQWALLAVVLWPRFMGAPQGRRMALAGWHQGEGVLKEIGCGIVGYLACVPVFMLGAVVSVILTFIESAIRHSITGQSPPPPSNPVFDIVSGKAGMLVVVMVYLLASLWAPIVEETVFRGCLYRQLRSKWQVLPAAAFTALCFGVMHAYPVLMMGPVIALGFGFALIREWRGSLIASMTAHCIHNAAVLGLLLVAMRLLG